jgi:PAS domain S-box-containing protein
LIDNQILDRREQFAHRYIPVATWGVAGLALATGAVGLIFPTYKQILWMAGILGLSMLGMTTFPLFRRWGRSEVRAYVALVSFMLSPGLGIFLLPDALMGTVWGFAAVIFLSALILGKRGWIVFSLAVPSITLLAVLLPQSMQFSQLLHLDGMARWIILLLWGGYPIPWIAVLLSRSVFEQENLFRQSKLANWEIEQRKATDQLQQQVLQTTRLGPDYHIIQLSAAAEVSRATGGILDPDELMYQVVEMTRERFGLYYVGLFLVERNENHSNGAEKWAVLRAGTSEMGRKMVEEAYKVEVNGDSNVGWCIAHKSPKIMEDTEEIGQRRKNPLLPETRSRLALPLISRGNAIGAMTFHSAKPGAFGEADITALQTMADQLANAIENARLYKEIKLAEEAMAKHAKQLEETTTFLNSVIENIPIMIFVKEAKDLKWVRWNKAGEETIGFSREELIGKSDSDIFPKEEADFFNLNDREALQNGELIDTPEEMVHTRHKGLRILHTLKVPIFDAEGKPQYLLGISEDITERKRAEMDASRTQAFLDSVVENIPITVFIKKADDLSFIRWNKAGEESTGVKNEEMIGKTDYDFFPKEEAEFFIAKDREALAKGTLVDIPEEPIHTRVKGLRLIHTIKVPIMDGNGNPLYLLGISEDITERKQAEEELRKAHDELEMRVQERTSELLSANKTLHTEIIERNRAEAEIKRRNQDLAALNMITTTINQSTGLNQILSATLERAMDVLEMEGGWLQFMDGDGKTLILAAQRGIPEPVVEKIKTIALNNNFPKKATNGIQPLQIDWIMETVRKKLDVYQKETNHTLTGVPITSKDNVIGILGGISRSSNELTANQVQLMTTIGHQIGIAVENERLTQQAAEVKILREVDRLRSELIANVSHELRTPLGLINISCSSLMMDDVEFDRDTQRNFLSSIEEEVGKLERIVENLLDLGRVEGGRLRLDKQPVDLAELARNVIRAMKTLSTQHNFECSIVSEPLMATVDAKRIEQVLRNLLDNAIKYSPNGGTISIQASLEKSQILISVTDQGIGIPADVWDKIFDRFYRAENAITLRMRGAGLGLSVCQGIVEAHGGLIWVESQPGVGSIFCLTLPANQTV